MTRAVAATVSERRSESQSVPCFELDHWHAELGVSAGITGREGEFDLGLKGNSPAGAVMSRWGALVDSMRPRFRGLVVGIQHHGKLVGVHLQPHEGMLVQEGLDGHATVVRGLLLVVLVADCIPVYLVDRVSRAVALLHAGWRGTAAGILETGVEQLCRAAGARPENLLMHCGVGICGSCYEVGPEVVRGVSGRAVDGPRKLDLRLDLAERAERVGIRDVTRSNWCTAHDAEMFYSHRALGGKEGRMAAYLGVPLT